jgi:guanosine-3',5'-bis(diphosphate) 3'-pyrophosphohydrolase
LKFFSKLGHELKHYLDNDSIAKVTAAYQSAKAAHADQKRHNGDPYITHPVAVALILARMRLDANTLMAALLHDVLEDTEVNKEQLMERFGEEVAELVDGVSKLTQIKFETREHAQAENFRKMVMAMSKDIRVILIKLADRLHNMRTLSSLPAPKRARIANETLEIYAPIANRLGMHAFRLEYEALGFLALYPMRYRILSKVIKSAKGDSRKIVAEINSKLSKRLKLLGLRPFLLMSREKHLYSIYKKMRQKQLSFAEVMDIYGFRLTVESVDMCYRVLGALHNLYKPLPNRFKDYIAIPKANGYQSLHTTLFGPQGVPIEIQIRTQAMDQMAENGIAAHWLYKTGDVNSNEAQLRARAWIKGVLEMQRSASSSVEFIENVKIDLFPDEIYVFTPKGAIMELPTGATPVDFAYAVHSDVGNACVAARINRKLTPLSSVLLSGQTVEVITAKGARPNPSWLHFVVTGKARSNIRHFMKTQRRGESVDLGQRLLEKAFQAQGVDASAFTKDKFTAVLKGLNIVSAQDLYEQIGLGNRMAAVVSQQMLALFPVDKASKKAVAPTAVLPLVIKGTEGVVVHYARCCRPIPGDKVAGCIDPGHGLEVHHSGCSELAEHCEQRGLECILLSWEKDIQGSFLVDIRIDTVNQCGLLARMANAFAEVSANINNLRTETHDGKYCSVDMTIGIQNRLHLARLFRRLKRVDGILKAKRLFAKPLHHDHL